MNTRSKYKTKQREILLGYLETVPGVHITASDVCEYFKAQGAKIINKYIIDGNSPACFEYMGADSHEEAEVCFHCKCEKCGKLIHLHCDELEDIRVHLEQEHHFKMDPLRTVFYGLCDQCS